MNNILTQKNLEIEINALKIVLNNLEEMELSQGWKSIIEIINEEELSLINQIKAKDITDEDRRYSAGKLAGISFIKEIKDGILSNIEGRNELLKRQNEFIPE